MTRTGLGASAESTPTPAGETYGTDSGSVPLGDDAGGQPGSGGWGEPDGGNSGIDSGTSASEAGTYDAAPPQGIDAGMQSSATRSSTGRPRSS